MFVNCKSGLFILEVSHGLIFWNRSYLWIVAIEPNFKLLIFLLIKISFVPNCSIVATVSISVIQTPRNHGIIVVIPVQVLKQYTWGHWTSIIEHNHIFWVNFQFYTIYQLIDSLPLAILIVSKDTARRVVAKDERVLVERLLILNRNVFNFETRKQSLIIRKHLFYFFISRLQMEEQVDQISHWVVLNAFSVVVDNLVQ
mgnify:CR=1 FL=1